jgi:hypothetical protein
MPGDLYWEKVCLGNTERFVGRKGTESDPIYYDSSHVHIFRAAKREPIETIASTQSTTFVHPPST